jgi:hypothetical protein
MPNVPNIQPDPLLPDYRYNTAAGRYIGPDGRFVNQQTIRAELDKVMDGITDKMVSLSTSFRTGVIDGQTFQVQAMGLIKRTHLASAALEKGGWAQLTQSDFGRVGQVVRQEYAYFNNLISQIESGKQRLDGTLDNRMRLYGQAGRGTYHKFERESRAGQGYDEVKRVRNARDSCHANDKRPGCVEEAARGFVPLADLVMIGDTTCLSNCRCDLVYKNSATGEII